MLTPAISSEIWKSTCAPCRAQPPFWMRRGALLNDAQNIGMSPTFVAGGEKAPGNWFVIAGLLGPGSLRLEGFPCVLIAPSGGSSGLPNDAASAGAAAARTLPPAVTASKSRREILSFT